MATTNLNGRNCTTKTAIVKAAGNTTVLAVEELLFKKGQHAYFSFFRYKPALCLGVTTASSYCAPAPKPNQSLPKNVFVRHPANTNMFDESSMDPMWNTTSVAPGDEPQWDSFLNGEMWSSQD